MYDTRTINGVFRNENYLVRSNGCRSTNRLDKYVRTTTVTAKWEGRLRRDLCLCFRLTTHIVRRIVTLPVVEYHETNGFTVKPKTLAEITAHLFFFPKTPFAFRPRAENAKQTTWTCRVCQRFWKKNMVGVRIVRRIVALSSVEYRKTNGFTVKPKKVD